MWVDQGALEISPKLAFRFLKDCEEGKVARNGSEPPISKVLTDEVRFMFEETTSRFSYGSGMAFLSALTDLHANQAALLNKTDYTKLREHPLLQQFKDNLKAKEIQARSEDPSEQNKTLALAGNPVKRVADLLDHLMHQNTFVALRNRALSAAQCFSISRYKELTFWRLCHMRMWQFPKGLPTTPLQAMTVLLITQKDHKNKVVHQSCSTAHHASCTLLRQVAVEDDLKVILRHKDVHLCPLCAVAVFFFFRFAIHNEKPIDFSTDEW